MVVSRRKRLVSLAVHDARRRYVQNGYAYHRVGMIETQPMRDTSASIVSRKQKTRMPEVAHQLDHVLCHCTLRIRDVLRIAHGLRRIAIPAKVGANNGEPMRKRRRNLEPDRMRLRISVQQQQRRSGTADGATNLGARRLNSKRRETGEEIRFGHRLNRS